MPEQAAYGWLLSAAVLCAIAGMGWQALAMPVHAQQVWATGVPGTTRRGLRWLGSSALAASFALCLAADHATMAVLVWVMAMSGSALLVASTLAARPHWLRALAPWVRTKEGGLQ